MKGLLIDMAKLKKEAKMAWRKDPIISNLSDHYDFNLPDCNADVYFDLVQSIISQQLSVKVSKIILERFLSLFENFYPYPNLVLSKSVEEFRKIGLSYQKANYIQNIAKYFLENGLMESSWHEMSDEEIMNKLCKIKGVGEWTVHMVLMFSLWRMDVFPIGDLAIRTAMIKHYKIQESERNILFRKLTEIAENWRPYRSIACHYLWASVD